MATTGTINSQGIGSGLDVSGIITKLMALEQKPLDNLKAKEASYQSKLTAFGTLKGAFASVQSAVAGLKSSLLFKNMTATPSDASVLSASANTAAIAGEYSLQVVARAQGQTIASQDFVKTASPEFNPLSNNIANADGKLEITVGTGTPVTIDIARTNSSLSDVRDAINNAKAGVTARIVEVSSGSYKLLVSSDATGADTGIAIRALDSSGAELAKDNTGLAKFWTQEFTVTMPAQDAHIKINNLDVYRPTNTISDAITGVTLSLTTEGTTSLKVAKNTDGVKTAIDAFVTAYNAASQQVRSLSAYNATTRTAAVLTGDSGARALQTALAQMLNFSVTTQSNNIRSFSDIGVTVQRDGTLKFDSTELDSALKSDPTAVSQLVTSGYNGNSGLATRLSTLMDSIMNEQNGVLASSTNGINSTIKSITAQETALQRRLIQIQSNYESQFTSMDKFVSSWNQTSSYLTQQLKALTDSSK